MFSGSWWKNAHNAASPERSATQRGWTISCSYLLPWRQRQTKVKKNWSIDWPSDDSQSWGNEVLTPFWSLYMDRMVQRHVTNKTNEWSGEGYLGFFLVFVFLKEILNTHQWFYHPCLYFYGRRILPGYSWHVFRQISSQIVGPPLSVITQQYITKNDSSLYDTDVRDLWFKTLTWFWPEMCYTTYSTLYLPLVFVHVCAQRSPLGLDFLCPGQWTSI